MSIQEKLDKIVEKNNSLVCVGLDSEFARIPEHLKKREYPQFVFNAQIIDATADLVCAFKPNSAFYEARGDVGIKELKMTCDYLTKHYPESVLILDAKRADIGSTNQGYVNFAFDYLGVDAITLHPYLGEEALKPFLDREDKVCIILCRTSNPGAGEFQDLRLNNELLFTLVAKKVAREWNKKNNCWLVLGAPYPEEMSEVRKIVGDMTFLVPGIGAQGADIEATVKAGLNSQKSGMVINSSRGIIFNSRGPREPTESLREEINKYR